MIIRFGAEEVDRAIREYAVKFVNDAIVDRVEITRGKGKTVYADVTYSFPNSTPQETKGKADAK